MTTTRNIPPTVEETRLYVRAAHAGQTDKAGRPYHEHPERVLDRMVAMFPDADDAERRAALLHDVLEDCPHVDAAALLALGHGERTVEIVAEVTRDKGDGRTYMDWMRDLAERGSLGAIRVKLADNADNSSPERIAALPEGERSIADRYARARRVLLRGLERFAAEGAAVRPRDR